MTELDLPRGWVNASYEDVYLSASNGTGGTQNKEQFGIPVSRIETIAEEKIDYARIGFLAEYDKEKVERHKLVKGDILFSHINSPIHLGKTAIYDGKHDLYHGINLLRIVVDREVILPKIFNWHCKYTRTAGEFSLRAQHAVNQSSLNQKKLGEFEIPLPPLAEQKAIADKLDTLLAQVETTKARLERIPEILKSFRQSVLAASVSGKLTEEWRTGNSKKDYLDYREICLQERQLVFGKKASKLAKLQEQTNLQLPDTWCWQTLDEVNVKITDGTHHSPQSFPAGDYMYVTSKNVREGRIDLSNISFVDEITHREIFSRCDVKLGDVLYVKDGANTGLSCVNTINEEFSLLSSVGVLRTCSFMEPIYVQHYLNSPIGRKLMLDLMGGTAIKRLTLTKIAISPISVPPKDEQTEIVRRVEELFAFADRIEQAALAAQSRVNHLTQSILAKAFRGELTADWRTANLDLISGDNSAEALLAKIKTERATIGKGKVKK